MKEIILSADPSPPHGKGKHSTAHSGTPFQKIYIIQNNSGMKLAQDNNSITYRTILSDVKREEKNHVAPAGLLQRHQKRNRSHRPQRQVAQIMKNPERKQFVAITEETAKATAGSCSDAGKKNYTQHVQVHRQKFRSSAPVFSRPACQPASGVTNQSPDQESKKYAPVALICIDEKVDALLFYYQYKK